MPRTKPSQINRTRALKVCEKIVLGMPLPDVCQLPGMPSMAAFLKWTQTDPAIGLMYRTAREISAYSLEELALSIARQNAENPGSPAQQKAIDAYLQQLRWAAEKRHPAVFSPRAAVNVTVPVQINTSLDLGGSPTAVAGPEMGSVYELTAEVEQEASLDDNAALERLVEPVRKQKLAAAEQRREAKLAKQRARMQRLRAERRAARTQH